MCFSSIVFNLLFLITRFLNEIQDRKVNSINLTFKLTPLLIFTQKNDILCRSRWNTGVSPNKCP